MRRKRCLVPIAFACLCLAADWPGAEGELVRAYESADAATRVALVAEAAARDTEAVMVLALGDPSVEVIRAALQRVRRGAGTALGERVFALLTDERSAVRAEAARAAGVLGNPRAFGALARATGDSEPAVRREAIEAVAALGGDGAAMMILDRVSDPEGPVRLAAVNALGALGDARAALSVLGALEDPNPEVRVAAAHALGSLRDPRAVRALRAALGDESMDVRRAATRALGALGPDAADAVDDLAAQALREDRTVEAAARGPLARAAIDALAVMRAPRALELLARVVREGPDEDLRAAAEALAHAPRSDREALADRVLPLPAPRVEALIDLLGTLGGAEATTALLEHASARDLRVDELPRVLRALARTGDPRALRWILRAAEAGLPRDDDRGDRPSNRGPCQPSPRFAAALGALREWHDRSGALPTVALDPLHSLLQATPPTCTETLATLIGLAGATRNARLGTVLATFSDHPSPMVRAAVLQALVEAPDVGPGPAIPRLSDPSPRVRLAAADLLARRGGRAEFAALVTALASPARLDRATTLDALGVIASRLPTETLAAEPIGPLDSLVGDPSPEISAASIDALARLAARGRPEALAALRRALVAGSLAQQRQVLEALGNALAPGNGDEAARALLRSHAGREEPAVVWALRALPESTPRLRALITDPRSAMATNASAALAHLAANGTTVPDLPGLCETWSTETREGARANLASVLVAAQAPCIPAVITRGLRADEATPVRHALVSALARAGGEVAARALTRCAAGDAASAVAARCAALRENGAAARDAEAHLAARDAEGRPLEQVPVQVTLADGIVVSAITGPGGWVRVRGVAPGVVRLQRQNN